MKIYFMENRQFLQSSYCINMILRINTIYPSSGLKYKSENTYKMRKWMQYNKNFKHKDKSVSIDITLKLMLIAYTAAQID